MIARQVAETYRRYSAYYDRLFGWSLMPGRRLVMGAMAPQKGDRILEIGVGTGISLGMYPKNTRVVGIDLSPSMLDIAAEKSRRMGWGHVVLKRMDAERLSFSDRSFDVCVAMYVVSVTPRPDRLMAEMARVTKPGGRVFVVNHFTRPGTLLRAFEKVLEPLAPRIGFHSFFPIEPFHTMARMPLAREIPVPPFGYWRVLEFRRTGKGRPQRRTPPGARRPP